MTALTPALVLLALLAPGALAAAEGAGPLAPLTLPGKGPLDPLEQAHRYARTSGPAPEGVDAFLLEGGALELLSPLERRWTYADLVEAKSGLFGAGGRFWRFERGTSGLVVRLQRWQRRLAFRVGASDAKGGQETFEGLEEDDDDHEDYGRTFAAADGQLRGDLTLVFGNTGSATTLDDVRSGRASVLSLNPFREVGAQFDFTILEDPGLANKGVVIFRIRAAYLGLFNQIDAGDGAGVAGDSQVGLGVGLKW